MLIGRPGTVANGTNRIGILVQCLVATGGFRSEGVSEFRSALPVLIPLCLGSIVGAMLAARLEDSTFERVFDVAMLALLIPTRISPPIFKQCLITVALAGAGPDSSIEIYICLLSRNVQFPPCR